MATTKQKYFLMTGNGENVSDFDTRQDVIDFLEEEDDLKQAAKDAYDGEVSTGDHEYRLFRGVEVRITAKSEDVKVTLEDEKY